MYIYLMMKQILDPSPPAYGYSFRWVRFSSPFLETELLYEEAQKGTIVGHHSLFLPRMRFHFVSAVEAYSSACGRFNGNGGGGAGIVLGAGGDRRR